MWLMSAPSETEGVVRSGGDRDGWSGGDDARGARTDIIYLAADSTSRWPRQSGNEAETVGCAEHAATSRHGARAYMY